MLRPNILSDTPVVNKKPTSTSTGRPNILAENPTGVEHPDVQDVMSKMAGYTNPDVVNEEPVTFPTYETKRPKTQAYKEDLIKRATENIKNTTDYSKVGSFERYAKQIGGGFIQGILQTPKAIDDLVDLVKGQELNTGNWTDRLARTGELVNENIRAQVSQDPTFADQLSQGIGSMGSFLIPSTGAGKIAGGTVKVVELFKGSEKLAEWIAKLTAQGSMTALESSMESGSVYDDVYEKTGNEKEAIKMAENTAISNAVLLGVTNKFAGYFEAMPTSAKNAVKRVLAGFFSEGSQEGGQQIISNLATDREWSEGVKDSALIGGIIGSGATLATANVFDENGKLDVKKVEEVVKKTQETRDKIIQAKQDGISTEEIAQSIAEKNDITPEEATNIVNNVMQTTETPTSEKTFTEQEDALVSDVKTAIEKGSRISAITSAIIDQYNVSPEYANSIVQRAIADASSVLTTEESAQLDTTVEDTTATDVTDVKSITKKINQLTEKIPTLPKGSIEKKNAKLELEAERAKLRTLKKETESPVKPTKVKPVEDKAPTEKTPKTLKTANLIDGEVTSVDVPVLGTGKVAGYDVFVHKGEDGNLIVSERSTGRFIGTSKLKTPEKAIANVEKELRKKDTKKETLEQKIKKAIDGKDVVNKAEQETPVVKNNGDTAKVGDTVTFHNIKGGKTIGNEEKQWEVISILKMKEGDKLELKDSKGTTIWTDRNSIDVAEQKAPVTQKEKVKEVVEKKGKATIKEIADETGILEPNVRRILGVGAKEGEFKRVDSGVYSITTPDGKEVAVVIPADAVETLPKLAKEGFKSDMVFLDIPYDTPAVKGGNRGVDYNLISVEQFGKVLDALSQIVREKTTPVIHMFSQAESGMKQMQKYNDLFLEKGFIPVARGEYQKTYKDGSPVAFPTVHGSVVTKPEGIIVFTQSGEVKKDLGNLNFRLVRPKGYATEKHADMLKSLIEMTTEEGDVVLDPFAGSGVTGAEAVKAKRKAVLIEKDKKVAKEITKPRVEKAVSEMPKEKTTKSKPVAKKKEEVKQEETAPPRESINVPVALQVGYKGTTYNRDFAIKLNGEVTYNGEVVAHIYDGEITAKQIEEIENDDKMGAETFSWDNTPDTQDANVYQDIADSINKAYAEIKAENDKALLENYNRVFPEKTVAEEDTPTVPKEKITDVGEKIGGARKDMWGKAQDSYSLKFTDAEIAKRKLSELFPKLDYKKLSEGGVSEDVLLRVAWSTALIPKKPMRSYAVARWVEQVKLIRGMIQDLLSKDSTNTVFEKALETMLTLKNSFEATKKMYKDNDFLNNPEVTKYTLDSKSYMVQRNSEGAYDPTAEKKKVEYYTLSKQGKTVKSFYPEDGQTLDSVMVRIKNYFVEIEAKKSTDKTNKEVDINKYIGLYQNRITGKIYSAYKKGKTFFEFETFENIDEARKLYRSPEKVAEYIKKLEEAVSFDEDNFRSQNANVEGKRTYRTGDVSAEEFQKAFGFRGVEFGNWVNQSERAERLNKAYDSFKDLASILGVPDQAISLNGELGFAFGARGTKGALAHYEAERVVINITKLGGAGTLAHEWFHALDNYLSRRDGSAFSFATEDGYNRAELDAKLKAIVDYLKNSDIGTRSRKADMLKSKAYWGTTRELTARGFEVFIKQKLEDRKLKNSFLVDLLNPADVGENYSEVYPYARSEDEVREVKRLYQEMVDTLMSREDEGKVALYKYKSEALRSDTPTASGAFLEDAMKRLKIDFDYKFFDSILGEYKKEAWGVTKGNTIALDKNAPFNTERHEFVHLTLKNLDKIDALKHITKFDLLMEQTEKMGLPIEMYNTQEVEEALAKGIENYERKEVTFEKGSKIKQFYDYLLEQFGKFLKAIGLSKGNLINEYYDILLYEESVNDEYVKLSNDRELTDYIKGTTLDLSEVFDGGDVETDIKMKEKLEKAISDHNELVKDITNNQEIMSVISRYADKAPVTEIVKIAKSQVEDYVKAVLEIKKIKQDISDASELFQKLVEKRENIEDLRSNLESKLVIITTKTHGTKGRPKTTTETVITDAITNEDIADGETASDVVKKMTPKKKVETNSEKKISAFQHRMLDLLSEQNRDDVTYNVMHKVEEVAKAEKYWEENKKRTIDMALGKEAFPDDVSGNVISLTVLQKAKEENDAKTIARVLPKLSLRATKQGQEIAMLANAFGERDPLSYMNKLIAMRKELAKKKYKPFFTSLKDAKSIDEVVTEKVKQARKRAPKLSDLMQTKIEDINSFLDDIKC